MIEVKFKKLCAEAVEPTKAHLSDAGADLVATSKKWDDEKQCWIYGIFGLIHLELSSWLMCLVLSAVQLWVRPETLYTALWIRLLMPIQ